MSRPFREIDLSAKQTSVSTDLIRVFRKARLLLVREPRIVLLSAFRDEGKLRFIYIFREK